MCHGVRPRWSDVWPTDDSGRLDTHVYMGRGALQGYCRWRVTTSCWGSRYAYAWSRRAIVVSRNPR